MVDKRRGGRWGWRKRKRLRLYVDLLAKQCDDFLLG